MTGDAPDMAERLARHGRIIGELLARQLAEDLVLRQDARQIIAISEICYETAAVNEHDTFELLIGLDVADKAQEWCEPRSGAEKIEILARQQVVDNQRAGRLLADDDRIAILDVLEPRCQGSALDLD